MTVAAVASATIGYSAHAGIGEIERILERLGMRDQQRALAEIIQHSAGAATPNHAMRIARLPKWPMSA